MNDLTFLIAIVIVNLIIAQIGFMIFRYFVIRKHDRFLAEIENLNDQVKNNKLSDSLFKQELSELRKKYKPEFYEKWWSRK